MLFDIIYLIPVRCCKPSTRTCIFYSNQKTTKTKFLSKFLENQKTENAHFINKIICLLKLLNFLFTHLKLILMNSKPKIINAVVIISNQNQKIGKNVIKRF